ncbi:hypothetical protein [Oryzibacter oryziterrae]|uniref:hypothetical protein n=1 Tax=Oryzibacter oryziterrae TaxID=2766474 RepID=UPI001F39A9A9|nr:hypothetical protein [Oryzibacter oryziterrae]
MSLVLLLHILFAGLWIGCVMTEVLFERTLSGQGWAADKLLARLHYRVDLAVEMPAALGVGVTGSLMAARIVHWDMALATMATAGLLAIAANILCLVHVRRRHLAALDGDRKAHSAADIRQHRVGTLVVLALLVAIGAAVSGTQIL